MLKQEGYDLKGAAFKIYNELGYLINFGMKGGLEWKRFVIGDLHAPKNRQE